MFAMLLALITNFVSHGTHRRTLSISLILRYRCRLTTKPWPSEAVRTIAFLLK